MVDGETVHVTLVRGGKGKRLTERDIEAIREMARCLKKYGSKVHRVRYERGPDAPGVADPLRR
jgi:hypothetical protein